MGWERSIPNVLIEVLSCGSLQLTNLLCSAAAAAAPCNGFDNARRHQQHVDRRRASSRIETTLISREDSLFFRFARGKKIFLSAGCDLPSVPFLSALSPFVVASLKNAFMSTCIQGNVNQTILTAVCVFSRQAETLRYLIPSELILKIQTNLVLWLLSERN